MSLKLQHTLSHSQTHMHTRAHLCFCSKVLFTLLFACLNTCPVWITFSLYLTAGTFLLHSIYFSVLGSVLVAILFLLAGPTGCASGYWTVPVSSWGPSCVACVAGTFLRQAGDTKCTQCPAGTFSSRTATHCNGCTTECGTGYEVAASCTPTADLVCRSVTLSGCMRRSGKQVVSVMVLVVVVQALVVQLTLK